MLKTERMQKVVIAGAKNDLRTVIETLHELKALHIEEHRAGDDFFQLGSPLPEGERIATALLKARGLLKSLDLEGEPATYHMDDLDAALGRVADVEKQVAGLVAKRGALEERIREIEGDIARLQRLAPLGLRVEELTGYARVKAYVGATTTDPRATLATFGDRLGVWAAPEGNGFVVAVIAAADVADKAEAVLSENGFSPIEVPEGDGTIDAAIGARMTKVGQARSELPKLEAALAKFRAEHGPDLLAAVEALETGADKAEAPLTFATGPTSFVVTGFVPASHKATTQARVLDATGHKVHVEWSQPAAGGHGHGHGHDDGHADEAEPEPPIKFAHKSNVKKSFTMLLGMHSLPKYNELDPTWFMFITFPIFFGIMIGDLGFGILTALFAWWLKDHPLFGIGGPRVSRMLVLSGVWTILFGTFLYGEAFGIHFVDNPGTPSWEFLFGADWSHLYSSAVHGTAHAAEAAGGGDAHHGAPHLVLFGMVQLGVYSKLHDVTTLLIIALVIAVIHLNIAITMGIRNAWVLHGPGHAIFGRFAWMVLQAGIGLVGYGSFDNWELLTNIGWVVFIVSVLMLLKGEGAIAILELPKIFSNALSYTRLTAVALSKAGMTLAVNNFAVVGEGTHWAINGAFGVVLILIGYTVILLLGVLSGGLHAMRLQFVEFFGWFYEGGGRPYKPFGVR